MRFFITCNYTKKKNVPATRKHREIVRFSGLYRPISIAIHPIAHFREKNRLGELKKQLQGWENERLVRKIGD